MEFINEQQSKRMTCAVNQLDSKQDSVFVGRHIATGLDEDIENFDWMINADGHGSYYTHLGKTPDYSFQTQFDALDKDELVSAKDPLVYIDEKIKYESYRYNVGSTLQIVRIFDPVDEKRRVEYFGIGDSEMRIFENKKLVVENIPHKIDLEKEQARNSARKDGINHVMQKGDFTLFVKASNMISLAPSSTITFFKTLPNGRMQDLWLSMSQSAGHHGITGYDPELLTMYFSVNSTLQIVIGSDGVFDVMNHEVEEDYNILCNSQTADEIVDFATSRWKQDWHNVNYDTCEYINPSRKTMKITGGYDDVSACVYHIEPLFDKTTKSEPEPIIDENL